MFSRILTAVERRMIAKYLKADGEKTVNLRQLALRYRKHAPLIREDLALLEKFAAAYEVEKPKH